MGWSLTLIAELLVSSKEWPSARGGEGIKIVLGFNDEEDDLLIKKILKQGLF